MFSHWHPKGGMLPTDDTHTSPPQKINLHHQHVQVPKMEGFLNHIAGYFGGGLTPLHKPYIYSLYR